MAHINYSKGFPLEALLITYFKHSRRLYLNYFEEFKLLCDFLAPISYPIDLQPRSDLNIFVTYETQEIGRILQIDPTILIQVLLRNRGYGPQT